MSLTVVTPPTAEPIDLADAKSYLRVTFTNDDALITAMIAGARNYAENFCQKQFVAARWQQTMDAFPQSKLSGTNYTQAYSRPQSCIYLERGPVTQVVSVNYTDLQGVNQVMPAANYTVDTTTDPARITPIFGQIWPIPVPQIGSVWVVFDTGYVAPITAAGNNITVQGWLPLVIGNVIRLSNSGGTLPAPLAAKTDYYIQSVVSPGVYTLSATSGGAVIPLTTTGTGTSYLSEVPAGLAAWLKLRIASLYENREELDQTGMVKPLPYSDRLLDPYKTYEF